MTPIDTQALRAVALAAMENIRGDWTAAGPSFGAPLPQYLTEVITVDGESVICTGADYHEDFWADRSANMAHIAAWNPAVAIALLDELDALRAAAKPAKGKQDYPAAFESAWEAYPPRVNSNKKATFRAWSARVKAGTDPADMLAGAARYAAFVLAERKEERFTLSPATFFGPDEHYALPWRPTRGAPAGAGMGKFDPVAHVNRNAMQSRNGDDGIIDITPR